MRYTLFVTDDTDGKQLYSSSDLRDLKRDADEKRQAAIEHGNEEIIYVVKQGYKTVYKTK
jgi:hypothetical protein